MGWARGSEVMDGIILAVRGQVEDVKTRKAIYRDVVKVLRDQDWDTMDESLGVDSAYDELYAELWPDEEDDDG